MSLSVHQGTLHARPVEHLRNGELRGGGLHGGKLGGGSGRKLQGNCELQRGDAQESPQMSAQAEINNLISSLGSLASQAGSLPITPPTLPGLPQQTGYQPQPTDYTYDQPN